MTRKLFYVVCLVVGALALLGGFALAAPSPQAYNIATGGKLYDKWWKVVPGAAEPKDDQALWSQQTTNTRKGADTWRCKECHGWDYKGKDGAYGSGSHKTGFIGVFDAAGKTKEQLVAALKGSPNAKHNFSSVLNDEAINNLVSFIKEGLIDETKYIDYATKRPKGADVDRGKQLYTSTCAACHGADGRQINFGSEQEPEYVAHVAKDNPWEFLHKVRAGQPGALMPSAIEQGWPVQNAVDVLAYAQTLPTEKPVVALPKTGEGLPLNWIAIGVAGASLLFLASGALMRRRARQR